MNCKDHLAGCFGPGYHFAGSTETRLNAVDYLRCNVTHLNAWLEIQQDIGDYLRNMNAPPEEIKKQIEAARALLHSFDQSLN
jgi:hypothetical protein